MYSPIDLFFYHLFPYIQLHQLRVAVHQPARHTCMENMVVSICSSLSHFASCKVYNNNNSNIMYIYPAIRSGECTEDFTDSIGNGHSGHFAWLEIVVNEK